MNYTYTLLLIICDSLSENNLCLYSLHDVKECCLVVFSGTRVKVDLNFKYFCMCCYAFTSDE